MDTVCTKWKDISKKSTSSVNPFFLSATVAMKWHFRVCAIIKNLLFVENGHVKDAHKCCSTCVYVCNTVQPPVSKCYKKKKRSGVISAVITILWDGWQAGHNDLRNRRSRKPECVCLLLNQTKVYREQHGECTQSDSCTHLNVHWLHIVAAIHVGELVSPKKWETSNWKLTVHRERIKAGR